MGERLGVERLAKRVPHNPGRELMLDTVLNRENRIKEILEQLMRVCKLVYSFSIH